MNHFVSIVIGFLALERSYGQITFNTYDQYGPLGEIKVVCDRTGDNPLLYFEVNATKFEGLVQETGGFDIDIPVPAECPPFKNAFLSYALGAGVHPPFDGRQFNGEKPGGYGMPHVDAHFLTITGEERVSRITGCVGNTPGPQDSTGAFIQCNYSVMNEAMKKFTKLPPPEYMNGFVTQNDFGGHAVLGHGMHLIPTVDTIANGFGPAHCVSTGPTGSWPDCMTQFMSFVMGGVFVEQNCKCGYWHDMTSAIMNVFDGQVVGNEVMPALGMVGALRSGTMSNPYMEAYPQASKYETTGYQPVATWHELVVDSNMFRAGLLLNSKYTMADESLTCGEIKAAYKSSKCCGNPERAFDFP